MVYLQGKSFRVSYFLYKLAYLYVKINTYWYVIVEKGNLIAAICYL